MDKLQNLANTTNKIMTRAQRRKLEANKQQNPSLTTNESANYEENKKYLIKPTATNLFDNDTHSPLDIIKHHQHLYYGSIIQKLKNPNYP